MKHKSASGEITKTHYAGTTVSVRSVFDDMNNVPGNKDMKAVVRTFEFMLRLALFTAVVVMTVRSAAESRSRVQVGQNSAQPQT